MEALERWWSDKYKLPSNHDLFQSRTKFDLLVEFYEDYYDKNPLDAHRNADGTIQFKDTGDDMIDKWEAEIAAGLTPDFYEDLSPEDQEKVKRLREKRNKSRASGGRSMKEVLEELDSYAVRKGLLPNVAHKAPTFRRR